MSNFKFKHFEDIDKKWKKVKKRHCIFKSGRGKVSSAVVIHTKKTFLEKLLWAENLVSWMRKPQAEAESPFERPRPLSLLIWSEKYNCDENETRLSPTDG